MTDNPTAQASAAEVLSLEDAARAYREAVAPLKDLKAAAKDAHDRTVDPRGVAQGSREEYVARMEANDAVAHQEGEIRRARKALCDAALTAQPQPAPSLSESADERMQAQLIDERDRATEAADRLAYALFSVEDIGEHTNLNCPWENAAERLEEMAAQPAPASADAHSDDLMVDALAAAMKAKLAKARAKGRGGWEKPDECSILHLWVMLRDHTEKANLDFVDVANLAGMLAWRLENVPGDRERLAGQLAFVEHARQQHPTPPAGAGAAQGTWADAYSREELERIAHQLMTAVRKARTTLHCINMYDALKPEVGGHWYVRALPTLLADLTPIIYNAKATWDHWIAEENERRGERGKPPLPTLAQAQAEGGEAL